MILKLQELIRIYKISEYTETRHSEFGVLPMHAQMESGPDNPPRSMNKSDPRDIVALALFLTNQ
jgi:hypothetical protein